MDKKTFNYIIRMGLAGPTAAFVAYALQLPFFGWIWVTITVYMVTDIRYGLTLQSGINRLLGTIGGIVLGYLIAVVFHQQNALSLTCGLFSIGMISGHLFYHYKFLHVMAMNAVVILTMSQLPDINLPAWKIAFERAGDNLLGIFIVFIISAIFFVGYSFDQLKKQVITFNHDLGNWLNSLSNPNSTSVEKYFTDYQQHLVNTNSLLTESRYEIQDISYSEFVKWEKIIEIQSRMVARLYLLSKKMDLNKHSEVTDLFQTGMKDLFNQIEKLLSSLNEMPTAQSTALLQQIVETFSNIQHHVDQLRDEKAFSVYTTESICNFYNIYASLDGLTHDCQALVSFLDSKA